MHQCRGVCLVKVMSASTKSMIDAHDPIRVFSLGLGLGLEPSTACGWESASMSNVTTLHHDAIWARCGLGSARVHRGGAYSALSVGAS